MANMVQLLIKEWMLSQKTRKYRTTYGRTTEYKMREEPGRQTRNASYKN
jgi:hypothetical protein